MTNHRRVRTAVCSAVACTALLFPLVTAPATAADVTGVDIVNHVSTAKVQDTVLVIDTTASMSDDIAQVREQAKQLVDDILRNNPGSRIGVVEYRDWAVPFTLPTGGYTAARTVVDLTSDAGTIIAGINSLRADPESNPDDPEDVLTGIVQAYKQQWRPGVVRNVIVIGDAPAHNPECATGLTIDDVVAYGQGKSLNVNFDNRDRTGTTAATGCQGEPKDIIRPTDVAPFQNLPAPDVSTAVSIIPEDSAMGNDPDLNTLAGTTGGTVFSDHNGNLGNTLIDVTTLLSQRPIVYLNGPAGGKAGRSVKFSTGGNTVYADGSYTISIDFGDGTPPQAIGDGGATSGSTGNPGEIWHRYDKPGTYTATITLTDSKGAKGTMSRRIVIGEGDAIPADALSAAFNPTDAHGALAGSDDLSATGSSIAKSVGPDGKPHATGITTDNIAHDPVKLVAALILIATLVAPFVVNSPAVDPGTRALFSALLKR